MPRRKKPPRTLAGDSCVCLQGAEGGAYFLPQFEQSETLRFVLADFLVDLLPQLLQFVCFMFTTSCHYDVRRFVVYAGGRWEKEGVSLNDETVSFP